MKASERTLQQLLHCSDQYVIPAFQRYYTWKTANWERLLSDFDELLQPGNEERRHFLGAIVTVPDAHQPGSIPAYQVIDGQQRLTTVSILLVAMRDLALERDWADLAAEIEENFLVHRFKKGRERYKVYLRLRDRDAYFAAVDRKPPVAAGGQVAAAQAHFLKHVRSRVEDETGLRVLFTALVTRLDFVSITLGEENPYQIFRSLNSTGEDLTQADLIRNHVFMKLGVDEQDAFDSGAWGELEGHFLVNGKLDGSGFEAFFRDALMRGGTYVSKDGAFPAFEDRYPARTLDPHAVVQEVLGTARMYAVIRGHERHPDPEVHQALAGIRGLDVSTAYPLALALLELSERGRMTTKSLAEALRGISGFVLRRFVCDHSSRGYGNWFVMACRNLADRDDPAAAVLAFLRGKGWPTDEVFVSRFGRFPLYESKYSRSVLEALEMATQAKSEPVVLSGCSIEHIVPQTIVAGDPDGNSWIAALGEDWQALHAQWIHTPGNLTLVGHDYNQSMSNRAFSAKKPQLASSKVYLNQHFQDDALTAWDAEAIASRGKTLALAATGIWPGPPAP